MLKIDHLTKIYKSSSRQSCTAIDDVSLELPNKGMIFIVGKSGSGKSTLLNLIGGLDYSTSGEIYVDGTKVSNSRGSDNVDKFRNTYMGFIFQDYYLIEMLNVFDNVKFALDLQHLEDEQLVLDTLKKVGLEGFEKRFPKELSGGQQQRVAIARAIIKNPKLILADEPTGNLDEFTSKQILDLLKELSKESLVVIVSHNLDHAKEYGDRIIRLSEGKIVADLERTDSSNELIIKRNEVKLPAGRSLTDEEIKVLNEKAKKSSMKFSVQQDVFETTKPIKDEPQGDMELKSSRLPLKQTIKLSSKFTRANFLTFFASIFIVSFLIIVFGLCQMIMSFDGNELLKKAAGTYNNIYILQKGYYATDLTTVLSTDKMGWITDEEIESFKSASSSDNVFLLYNMSVPLDPTSNDTELGYTMNHFVAYQEFYARNSMGVLQCTEDYIARIYGENGEIKYVSQASSPQSYGIYITDYMADAIVHFTPELYDLTNHKDPYNQLISWRRFNRISINGIIDTGYKERYAELIEAFETAYHSTSRDEISKIYSSQIYLDFVDEARTSLNMAYATSPDFINETIEKWEYCRWDACLLCCDFVDENDDVISANTRGRTVQTQRSFPYDDDEIIMDMDLYNSFYGTSLTEGDTSQFEERDLTIEGFMPGRNPSMKPLYSRTFKVVGVSKRKTDADADFYVSQNTFAFFRGFDVFPYGVVFEAPSDIAALYNVGEPHGFYSTSPQFSAVYTIVRVMTMYKDLFLTIAIVLCIACLLILINFGRKAVRSRVYEIGIIRALGGRKVEIVKVFIIQLLLVSLLICALSIPGLIGVSALANSILSSSLTKITKNPTFGKLTLLVSSPVTFAIIIGTVLAIAVVSALIPLIILSRIKPLNIIKSKE